MKSLDDFLLAEEAKEPPQHPHLADRSDWHMPWGEVFGAFSDPYLWFVLAFTTAASKGVFAGIVAIGMAVNLVAQILALSLDSVENLSKVTWYKMAYHLWKRSKEGKEWLDAQEKARQNYLENKERIDRARVEAIAQQLQRSTQNRINARKRSGKPRMTRDEVMKKYGKK